MDYRYSSNLELRRWLEVGGHLHDPAVLPPGNDPVPIYRWLGGPQAWSERMRKISPLPGFDPWICRPIASLYSGPLYSWQRKAIILIQLVLAVRFLGVNHPRCELDHSSSSNVKVKSDWSSTSTLCAFMASKGTNVILDIIITYSRVVHMHFVKFQLFLHAYSFWFHRQDLARKCTLQLLGLQLVAVLTLKFHDSHFMLCRHLLEATALQRS